MEGTIFETSLGKYKYIIEKSIPLTYSLTHSNLV